jgi:ribosome-associated heat shock protein Hsp15
MIESARADKWLWSTRFFKTRGLAAEICALGKVTRCGYSLKPASLIHLDDVLEIPFLEGPGARMIMVKGLITQRVGAQQAQEYYEERTPKEVFEALKLWLSVKSEVTKGRPTKRDRREIDKIHGFWD